MLLVTLVVKSRVALPLAFWQMGSGSVTVKVGAVQAQLTLMVSVVEQPVSTTLTVTVYAPLIKLLKVFDDWKFMPSMAYSKVPFPPDMLAGAVITPLPFMGLAPQSTAKLSVGKALTVTVTDVVAVQFPLFVTVTV